MKNINPTGQPIKPRGQTNMPLPPASPLKGVNKPAPKVPKNLPMDPKYK